MFVLGLGWCCLGREGFVITRKRELELLDFRSDQKVLGFASTLSEASLSLSHQGMTEELHRKWQPESNTVGGSTGLWLDIWEECSGEGKMGTGKKRARRAGRLWIGEREGISGGIGGFKGKWLAALVDAATGRLDF